MSEYTFDPKRAEVVVQQLEMVDSQIKQMLMHLDENTRRNLASWGSETKDAYTAAKTSWDNSANAMPLALANARAALMQIAHTYGRMESNGSSLFGGR